MLYSSVPLIREMRPSKESAPRVPLTQPFLRYTKNASWLARHGVLAVSQTRGLNEKLMLWNSLLGKQYEDGMGPSKAEGLP